MPKPAKTMARKMDQPVHAPQDLAAIHALNLRVGEIYSRVYSAPWRLYLTLQTLHRPGVHVKMAGLGQVVMSVKTQTRVKSPTPHLGGRHRAQM